MELFRQMKHLWLNSGYSLAIAFCYLATFMVLAPSVQAQEKPVKANGLKSGPAVGEQARPYHPLLANGKTTGQRWCMVCTHRGSCKAMILAFVRKHDKRATQLMTALEAATKKHDKAVGIITYLTTEGKTARDVEALTGGKLAYLNEAEKKQFESLRAFSKKNDIKSSLNIYSVDGPAGYNLSPDAALTVLVADTDAVVKANIAMRDSEFTEDSIKAVVKEIETALSTKN